MIDDLKKFAGRKKIFLQDQKEISEKAIHKIRNGYQCDPVKIKANFDTIISDCEQAAYDIYLEQEKEYGQAVFSAMAQQVFNDNSSESGEQIGRVLGEHFNTFDKFFLSLAQSRKSRAGKTFEKIHNSLFKDLEYPFDEQAVINGKPDFVMPSVAQYKRDPLSCIVFTAKRTLRERWRQIVTEGTRGIGFFLATIDTKVSTTQLDEMKTHKIYMVVPETIRKKYYDNATNAISFKNFFEDHLDPKMKIWKRENILI